MKWLLLTALMLACTSPKKVLVYSHPKTDTITQLLIQTDTVTAAIFPTYLDTGVYVLQIDSGQTIPLSRTGNRLQPVTKIAAIEKSDITHFTVDSLTRILLEYKHSLAQHEGQIQAVNDYNGILLDKIHSERAQNKKNLAYSWLIFGALLISLLAICLLTKRNKKRPKLYVPK